ncbi:MULTISPECIES: 5' nucleotidase, NT5C type [Mycobacteriaceae]|uniref:5' nucleotidase, NT5C type n=1 Tax=Mycobacteriaceae TaxID=1762 RepID=UPI00096CC45A|nr:hypothetical protein [Mycolicibacterium conceptionense]OMB73165.1 hypothetical protein A5741_05455 [Mycolicibacterium conceptionense]
MIRRPLHIGLDVDGVLADYMAAIAEVGRGNGHAMSGEGPLTYGLIEPGWFPDALTAATAMAQLHESGLGDLALFDDTAPAAVRELRNGGHKVSIVTARQEHRVGESGHRAGHRDLVSWLARHGIETDDLLFQQRKSLSGCDVYLDDAPHNIDEIRSAGGIAVVRDTTYNRQVPGPRVISMAEFADRVLRGDFNRQAA